MTSIAWTSSLAEALASLAERTDGARATYPIRHGTMRVGVYAPRKDDPQKPHTQDELYIIASGTGEFVKGAERISFAPGDVLFLEAGATHRFEKFSDDFATWVIFWGQEGGEG